VGGQINFLLRRKLKRGCKLLRISARGGHLTREAFSGSQGDLKNALKYKRKDIGPEQKKEDGTES